MTSNFLGHIQIGTAGHCTDSVPFYVADLNVHVFVLSEEASEADVLHGATEGEDEISPCTQWLLPRKDFAGLWVMNYLSLFACCLSVYKC